MLVSHDAVPDLTDQVLRADQAVKAELFTADRRLIIAGCSYYWPEAYSVAVLPRLYGAAFLSFGLATMDGLEGKNRIAHLARQCVFRLRILTPRIASSEDVIFA